MMLRAAVALAAAIIWPSHGQADTKRPILNESFTVTLPANLDLAPRLDVPAETVLQQLIYVNEAGQEILGLRPAIYRIPVYTSIEARASWPQRFRVHPDPSALEDREFLTLVETEGYFGHSGESVRPLRLNQRGRDWWGFEAETGFMLSLNSDVPSIRACRRHLREAICISHYLEEDDWRRKLALPRWSTELDESGILAFRRLPEMRQIVEILSSVHPTETYRPCCVNR